MINKLYKVKSKIQSMLPYISRPFLRYVANETNHSLIGAEVGVARGENALNIIRYMNIKKLYLIDPYPKYVDGDGVFRDYSIYFKEAKNRLKKYNSKIAWINKDSKEVVKEIKSELDFVYIDGKHTEKAVTSDITSWYPLIKQEAFIGGDDFNFRYIGVINAVIKFRNKYGLQLYTKDDDWWYIKGGTI